MAVAYPARDLKELVTILREIDQINPIIRLMLEFEARTGLRYGDSSRVKFSDVMVNGVIKDKFEVVMSKLYQKRINKGMARSMAKNKSTIIIPINAELKALIEECQQLNPGKAMLFQSDAPRAKPDTAITIQYTNKVLKRVAEKLELPYKLSTHSMRKSCAMMIMGAGGSVHDVQKRLGHSSLSSTEHYLNTFIDESQLLMSKISFDVN